MVTVLHINRESFSHKLYQTVLTFGLIDITWIFFRAGGTLHTFKCFKSIVDAKNIWILFDDSLFELGLDWKNFVIMMASIVLLFAADYFKYKGIMIRKVIVKQGLWFRYAVFVFGIAAILTFGIWGAEYEKASFIYFQF